MQAVHRLANGPRRAQSKAFGRVFCDAGAHVSRPGYVSTRKEHGRAVKQGGTADKQLFVLGSLSVGAFFDSQEAPRRNPVKFTVRRRTYELQRH